MPPPPCGRIIKPSRGIEYVNDGDWVESCTALVEHPDGRLEILRWAEMREWSVLDRRPLEHELAAA